jgi:hypothetical protein
MHQHIHKQITIDPSIAVELQLDITSEVVLGLQNKMNKNNKKQ